MKNEIVLVGADRKITQALSVILENWNYRVTSVSSLLHLNDSIQERPFQAMIIDIDGLPVAENFFRDLKKSNPSLRIMGLSKHTFHPDLVEAISKHLFACLKKPVNSDELFYLLKSIYENN